MAPPTICRAIWLCTLAVVSAALAPLDIVSLASVPECPKGIQCGNKDYQLNSYSCNEKTTPLKPGQADMLEYRCFDGRCISVEGLHNGYENCLDGSDEHSVTTTEAPTTTKEASTTSWKNDKGPLVVTVRAADGLQNTEWMPGDASDPYVLIEIEGKPGTQVRSNVYPDSLDPEWNFRAELPKYVPGDTIVFAVLDADNIDTDDNLGHATLVLDSTPWHGNLKLLGAKAGHAFLEVQAAWASEAPTTQEPTDKLLLRVLATTQAPDEDGKATADLKAFEEDAPTTAAPATTSAAPTKPPPTTTAATTTAATTTAATTTAATTTAAPTTTKATTTTALPATDRPGVDRVKHFPFLPWPAPPGAPSVRVPLAACGTPPGTKPAPQAASSVKDPLANAGDQCATDGCIPSIPMPSLPPPPAWPLTGENCTLPFEPHHHRVPINIFDVSHTLGCAIPEVTWEPLDMRGISPTTEVTIAACQAKCSITPGCAHYAYWLASGLCHLQDSFAYRTYNRIGFISGPAGCQPEETSLALTITLLKKRVCYDVDTSRTPLDIVTPGRRFTVLECQQWCFFTPGCRWFTYNSLSQICHLQQGNVTVWRNMQYYVSGPRKCQCPVVQSMHIDCIDYAELSNATQCLYNFDMAIRQAYVLTIGLEPLLNINNVGSIITNDPDGGVNVTVVVWPPNEISFETLTIDEFNGHKVVLPQDKTINPSDIVLKRLSNTQKVERHVQAAVNLVPGIKKYYEPGCDCLKVSDVTDPALFLDAVTEQWERERRQDALENDVSDPINQVSTEHHAEVKESLMRRYAGTLVLGFIAFSLVGFTCLSGVSICRANRRPAPVGPDTIQQYMYSGVGGLNGRRGGHTSGSPQARWRQVDDGTSNEIPDVDDVAAEVPWSSAPLSAREIRAPRRGVSSSAPEQRPRPQVPIVRRLVSGDVEEDFGDDDEARAALAAQ